MTDAIAAVATPIGSGAIAIIRISGTKSQSIVSQAFKPYKLNSFTDAVPQTMYLGTYDTGVIRDKCLCVYFKAPVSYTGEDMVEIQCHGGVKIVDEILSDLLRRGARIADKGEFTRRAFYNDKLSLDECEGIIDMINAESTAQINAAYYLSKGALKKSINDCSEVLLDAISSLEVGLDGDGEYEDYSKEHAKNYLIKVKTILDEYLSRESVSNYLREGVKVALVGLPNRGKSSLLNALCRKERAIVTSIAGTTRDTIEEQIEYKGIKFVFIDTAGLRTSDDVVEKIGIDKAFDAMKSADVVVQILSAIEPMLEDEKQLCNSISDKPFIRVYNKCDLCKNTIGNDELYVSAKTGFNVDKILDRIFSILKLGTFSGNEELIITKRHAQTMKESKNIIDNLMDAFDEIPIDCALLDMREAYLKLGEISGTTANDNIIDNIFQRFCVGK